VVPIPDERVDKLAEIEKSAKKIYTTIEFVDIAGLVKGASQGEGLGNEFLGHIREVDALIHVVRDFSDENIIRSGSVSPKEDVSIIETELILSDLAVIEKIINTLSAGNKSIKNPKVTQKIDILNTVKTNFEKGVSARSIGLSEKEIEVIFDVPLLTLKPELYLYNVDEDEVAEKSKADSDSSIFLCAKIESELAGFSEEEKIQYLTHLGLQESGLDRVIRKGYKLLSLQSFLTMGPKEVRAWTIKKGTNARKASAKIHTDFEKGFIAADIINFDELDKIQSLRKARDLGLVRLEGKDYLMQEGDVVEFRINV